MDDTTLFLVLSNPVAGKDDEFNEWYDNVHVRDVLSIPGMMSAQRYALYETEINRAAGITPTHRYLCVYEMKGDPDSIMGSVQEAVASGAMSIHEALDLETSLMSFWTARGAKVQA